MKSGAGYQFVNLKDLPFSHYRNATSYQLNAVAGGHHDDGKIKFPPKEFLMLLSILLHFLTS